MSLEHKLTYLLRRLARVGRKQKMTEQEQKHNTLPPSFKRKTLPYLLLGLLSLSLLLMPYAAAARTVQATGGSYWQAALNLKQEVARWFGNSGLTTFFKLGTGTAAMPTIAQQATVSGCYYAGGQSRATVSVEVSWTGLSNGQTINVVLNSVTRTITPDSTANPPIVSPQVVAFEIPADSAARTVTATLASDPTVTNSTNVTAPAACAPLVCGANQLGGTVFNDYNADGVKQAGEINGVGGVTVQAYDSTGTTYTTTTNGAGRYCLNIPVANYPVRVEFTGLPAEFVGGFTTQQGTDSGTSVQFIAAPDSNLDLGVNNPIDFCQANPKVMTPCYVFGDPLSTTGNAANDSAAEPALVKFDYSLDGVETGVDAFATAGEVGSLWGIAYKKQTGHLFGATVVRRHSGLGPQGIGGLYVLNPAGAGMTGNVLDAWSVETQLGIDMDDPAAPFGGSTNPAMSNTNRGLSANKTSPSQDAPAFSAVGKLGFGDIDLSDDGNTLWFVNHYDKKLYAVNIANYNPANTATRPTAANVTSQTIPNPGCTGGQWRPSGLKFRRGIVYVGGVCDASTSQTLSDLRASVQTLNTVSNSWAEVFNLPLTYPKGSSRGPTEEKGWHVWSDDWDVVRNGSTGNISYSVPIFSDIEFDVDGTMVLGFNDRTGMQTGRANYSPLAASGSFTGFTGGDALRAFFSNGTYVLENNAKAGPVTGFGPNNNQGPGFGEFYEDNWRTTGHTETIVGGLGIRPGSGEVAVTSMDPHDSSIWAAGVRYMSNSTGLRTHALAVYSSSDDTASTNLGKSTGLGDVEMTCQSVSYLELGNRVWMDANNNGVQDPNEMALSGVTVRLYTPNGPDGVAGNADDKNPIASAVTDSNGEYYFTSTDANNDGAPDNDTNTSNNVGLIGGGAANPTYPGIQPFTRYVIRFDRAQDYQTGGALANKVLALLNQDNGAFGQPGDLHDSDAAVSNVLTIPGVNFPEIEVQHLDRGAAVNGTGAFGQVDHTFDAGFRSVFSVGNRVWKDLNNSGTIDAADGGSPGVNGVTVRLFNEDGTAANDANGVAVAAQVTANGGYYRFDNLLPGNYLVEVAASNFTGAGVLLNCLGSTTDAGDPDTDLVDSNDNGAGSAPGVNGIRSLAITLGPLVDEPTNETDRSASDPTEPNANTNLTVDFGFVPPVSIGNTVWLDTDNDGQISTGEVGRDGVRVELFFDADGNGSLTGAEQTPVAVQTTSSGGYYLFTQRTDNAGVGAGVPLTVGRYFVGVAPSNFTGAGVLAGYQSSSTSIANNGVLSDATVAANTNSDGDNIDDGLKQFTGAPFYTGGVLSGALVTTMGGEPASETTQPANTTGGATNGHPNTISGVTIPDNNSNVTVDFGFYKQCLGDIVFQDNGAGANANNGQKDAGEQGVSGVVLKLYAQNGTTEVPVGPDGILGTADDTTGGTNQILSSGSGAYSFCGLPAGQYIVKATAPAGSTSSQDRSTSGDPNNLENTPDDDNGVGFSGGVIASNALTLTPGTPNAAEGVTVTNTDGTTSNPTLDFGLILAPPVAVGNTVWLDTNNNGAVDAGEIGRDGVLVELFFDVDGNGSLTAAERTPAARQLTSGGGYYLFTQTTDAAGVGTGVQIGASATGRYYVGVSPFNFSTGLANPPATIGGKPFTAGLLVGYQSSSTTINNTGVVADATVAANTDTDSDNLDDGLKQNSASTHSFYVLSNVYGVLSGALRLDVNSEPTNETTQPGNVSGGATPPNDANMAYPMGHYSSIDGSVNTQVIQPDESNVTVDFGFYTGCLGNLVFGDYGAGANYNNAKRDTGEQGMAGLTVKLYAANGTTEINAGPDGIFGTADDAAGGITTGTGANAGLYNFCGLPEGDYRVQLTAPPGFRSSDDIATTLTPNDNTDDDDNGEGVSVTTTLTRALTLDPGAPGAQNKNVVESTSGRTTDPTLDLALLPRGISIGNTVWFDTDNDGEIDANERGKDGARVELFADTNGNNTLDAGAERTAIAVQLTSSGGYYLFTQTTDANGAGTGTPLLPGKYFVGVAPSNFVGAGMLVGYHSSGTTISNAGALSDTAIASNGASDSNADNFDDGGKQFAAAPFYVGGVLSGVLDAQPGTEPTNETTRPAGTTGGATPGHNNTLDGTAGGPPILDANSNVTVDFGFYTQCFGDLVFNDNGGGASTNNGRKDTGENGVSGVPVKLYAANGTTEIGVGVDGRLGTADDAAGGVTANNSGIFTFCGLPQGSYIVKIDAPSGYVSSTDPTTAADPNNNTNEDDNGVGNAGGVIASNPLALTPGPSVSRPNNTIDDTTGTSNNPTLDFALYQPVTVGNQVFFDLNNNSTREAAETGLNNVALQLFNDTDADGQPDTPQPLAAATTAAAAGAQGMYLFTQQTLNPANGAALAAPIPLPPGKYVVCAPAANFNAGQPLAGHFSSGTTATANGSPSETAPADPNAGAGANPGVDSDDNGAKQTAGACSGGVLTRTLDVTTNEPLSENPDNDPTTADARENLTLDLGFYTMSLGNCVYNDKENDAVFNGTDVGMSGVTVRLLAQDGVTVLGTQPTDANGRYVFMGLAQGMYFVEAVIPTGYVSSRDITSTADPNNKVDSDDNGIGVVTPAARTAKLTLTPGSAPLNESDNNQPVNGSSDPTPDSASDKTADFGLVRYYSLGNRLWADLDNNGRINTNDTATPGVNGVTVCLLKSDLSPATDLAGNPLPVVTTANGGYYRFDLLPAGNYIVEVKAENFGAGKPLFRHVSSTGANSGTGPFEAPPDPNDDADGDDNGQQGAAVRSKPVTLGEGVGTSEPTSESDLDAANPNPVAPNNQTNLTVDLGFTPLIKLGNLVWKDYDNSGTPDAGEPGINGVLVELLRDANNDGVLSAADGAAVKTTTTSGAGSYLFDEVLPGNYFVRLAPSNFAANGMLKDCASSTFTGVNPNSDLDNDDNGLNGTTTTTSGIPTGLLIIIGKQEPGPQVDGDDTDSNQAIDFGLIFQNIGLGDSVFKDLNRNGTRDGAEPGIKGVLVELFFDNGDKVFNAGQDTLVASATTDEQGNYSIVGQTPGRYFVRIAPTNFATGGPLDGCISTKGAPPPDNDVDRDDNGSDSLTPQTQPPISGILTLISFGEPTNDGDDNNSNRTVDFGFATLLAVLLNDPLNCIGPGAVFALNATVFNSSNATLPDNPGPEFAATIPLPARPMPGSCVASGGNGVCEIVGQQVLWNGTIAPGAVLNLTYRIQAPQDTPLGTEICVDSVSNFDADLNGTNESSETFRLCTTLNCPPVGPGEAPTGPGSSLLIYPIYTSNPNNAERQNTRFNLTNLHQKNGIAVHLFFVDGATCAVTDSYVCLTPNQTASFLAADLDPGITGYLVALATDPVTGCPVNFNYLIGSEQVKFSSGHFANLPAECIKAINFVPECDASATTAQLNFDGNNYGRLPRTLALDSLPSRVDSNDTMLIVNNIGGSLLTGTAPLGALAGLLYDDTEHAFSFTFRADTCQFRASLDNTFPRTTPRLEHVVPAGRTGWLKFFGAEGQGLIGAAIKHHANSGGNNGAFNSGHGLHTLTQAESVSVTVPIFPPVCR